MSEQRKPRGEAEVVDAVIDAASELFSEIDPDSVSLREIAARANVNYNLIHRHLGTKLDVVAAAIRRHSSRFRPSPEATHDPVLLMGEMARYYLDNPMIARTLAWASLNGADPVALVAGLPDVQSLVAEMGEVAADTERALQAFGFIACAVLGVGVFDGVALTAGGDASQEQRERLLDTTVRYAEQLMRDLGGVRG